MKKNSFKRNIKLVFCSCIFLVVVITSFLSIRKPIFYEHNHFLESLLLGANKNIQIDNNVIQKVLNSLFSLNLNNMSSILNNGLMYEPIQEDDYHQLEELQKITFHMKNPNDIKVEKPLVYIYNTHQLENYSNKNFNEYNIVPNVMMASYILQENLINNGIPTIVDEDDFTKELNDKGYLYYQSYVISKSHIKDALATNPTVKYIIDIHRDSVGAKITKLSKNNKDYAKVLFVVGLEHENYQENLDLAIKVSNAINKIVPGLSRGVYKKEGPGVDGIYNQDMSSNALLLEMGGVDSTIIEVNNSMEVVSQVVSNMVRGNW